MSVTISHRLPGRLRVVVDGIRNEAVLAYRLQSKLLQMNGIQDVHCSAHTGRALVHFDESCISFGQVVGEIERWMTSFAHSRAPQQGVAATIEADMLSAVSTVNDQPPVANPYLLPTIASSGLLAVLSLKRMFMGRSALATSPLVFWAASGMTIAAGYPALRRGIENLVRQRKLTPDLWLGLATLSMAAVRENIVALSVITALNLAMYRRYAVTTSPGETRLTPELESHSRRMTRLSLWLSPLALFLTRSPLRALGVALAANPRPAILAHEYRWAQAEREAGEKTLPVHLRQRLASFASVKNIVFTDDQLISGSEQEWKVHPVSDKVEVGKITAIAASLLQKRDDHPWREALVQRAVAENRTVRTAFNVQCRTDGMTGRIQGHEIMLGTLSFISKLGIDETPVAMEERRMRNQGYHPQILVVEGHPVGIIGCKRSIHPEWERTVNQWKQSGYRVMSFREDSHTATVLDGITLNQLVQELELGNDTIVVGDQEFPIDHACFIQIPAEHSEQLPRLLEFCRDKAHLAQRDVAIVKAWNLVGVALALAVPSTAPLIGLASDVVAMGLMAMQQWTSRNRSAPTQLDDHDRPHTRLEQSFHDIDFKVLLQKLGASTSGLTNQQAMERQGHWGENLLAPPAPTSVVRTFLNQFKELSTLILLGTTGLSFAMGERLSAMCMFAILLVNAMIGTWQERRSAAVIHALKREDTSQTKVIRDGKEQTVLTKDLVPGDMVLLEAGDKVPADMRIMEAWNLEVSEAMLTGESVPVAKHAAQLTAETPLAERTNVLFMGTVVTRGRCNGLVTATGSSTEIGALQSLLNQHEETPTFLQNRVAQISKHFVVGAFIAAGIVGIAGLLHGVPPAQLLISSVTLAASAIPEGLPITITVALTAGVLALSKRRALVKKLAHLESLGRVTVICSDKTGTLTRNEMTVKEMVTVGRRVRVTEGGDVPRGNFVSEDNPELPLAPLDDPDVGQLLTIGMLCNNASFQSAATDVKGDPTEVALLKVAAKANLSHEVWKRHREIPFDFETRSMSVVCEENLQTNLVCEDVNTLQRCMVFSKGAAEEVLQKCTHYLSGGEVHPMTAEVERRVQEENRRMADGALRVLAFAYRPVKDDEDVLHVSDNQLIYVGLMGMMDPPKEGVAESIEDAKKLGIKPVMITGDHPLTARSIGMQLGIFHEGDRILTGGEIDKLSPEALDRLIVDASIFARVSPEHKLRIVEAYQRNGEVVAMTGDGVNDAPAMRQADVGIAMGLNGTDIAKGAAGVVLMEDHFHSIVDGVKGGRAIIGNIRKAMGCLLAGNLAEVLVTAVSIVIGLPVPLIPLQILLMNILTDAVPAMVLATGSQTDIPDKPYKDVIDRSLYKSVLTRGCVLGFGAVGVFAIAMATGMPLPLARTMTYTALVVGQLIQTVAWRRYGARHKSDLRADRVLLTAAVASWLALAATIYVTPLATVFGTVPIRLRHWAVVLAVTGGLAWVAQRWIEWSSQRGHVPPAVGLPGYSPAA